MTTTVQRRPLEACPQCHTDIDLGARCGVCDYPRRYRPIRAVVVSIVFIATGVFGFLISPLYIRWVAQKGKLSIVTIPVELFVPGLFPKIAALVFAGWVAVHFGLVLGGNDWAGWLLAAYLFVDIPIRLVVVPYHLYQYFSMHKAFQRGTSVS